MTHETTDAVPVSPREGETPQPHPPTSPKRERLRLPPGAFIAFRKSGGKSSSSHEIVIYPDGRVSYGGPDLSKAIYARVGRKLNDAQIARLRKLLNQADFFRWSAAPGTRPPEAYTYEIVARLNHRINAVQVVEGSIPAVLEPLVQQLNAWMPKEPS